MKKLYEDWEGRLMQSRGAHARVAKNVTIHGGGDHLALRLHATDIVLAYPDGSLVLTSGGYRTSTTLRWINEFLPSSLQVWTEKNIWYIGTGQGTKGRPFQDGTKIGPRGGIRIGRGPSPKRVQSLKKKVDDYAKTFVEKMFAGKIPAPGSGDCWFCQMVTTEGVSMGDIGGNAAEGHLLGHLREKYYVPALLQNALKEGNLLQGLFPWPLAKFWIKQEGLGDTCPAEDMLRGAYTAAIRKYFYRRLGIAGNPSSAPAGRENEMRPRNRGIREQ